MKKTLYSRCTVNDISPYVIFSGDPGRVKMIADRLDETKLVSENREFTTYTGEYKGVPITVTSTGIGGPSAAIALEEMAECGMKVAIRIGTVMGLGDTSLGELIIPVGCMRSEATSKTYVEEEYPAVADPVILLSMSKAAVQNDFPYNHGVICSMDGFYSQMKESILARSLGIDINGGMDRLERYKIAGIDMESGVILTLSRLMGIKAGVVVLTTVRRNLDSEMDEESRVEAVEGMINVVLDGIKIYDQEGEK